MITWVIVAGIFALTVGFAVLWANPSRFTNQVFALTAVLAGAHLFFVYRAIRIAIIFAHEHVTSPVAMIRAGAMIAAFFPWMLWLLKESLVSAGTKRLSIVRRSWPWLGIGGLLALICLTNLYIPSDSLPTNERHGWGYAAVNLTLVFLYAFLVGQLLLQTERQCGIKRVESQFLVLNGAVGALLAVGLTLFGYFLHLPSLRRMGPIVIIVSYALSAWAISYYRIFDARHVFVSLAQRAGLFAFLALGVLFSYYTLDGFVPQPLAILMGILAFGSAGLWLDHCSRNWLGLSGERELGLMRRTVIELARTEPHPEKLMAQFEAYLCERCNASRAALLFDNGERYADGRLAFTKVRAGYTALCTDEWATPESLVRRPSTVPLKDLGDFLSENVLGLILAAPRGSPLPTLLVAFGIRENEWPFTYPEVQRLQNISELMDNILTRSRLTMQAAAQAKIEHLAMLSRGLAHDLNNLITPVASFLVHTDNRFPPHSMEEEVHAAAKRSVRVMSNYVREALLFSETLTPTFEWLEPSEVFREVDMLMALRAGLRKVDFKYSINFAGKLVADGVLLQRSFANIVGNAIDASQPGQKVILSVSPSRPGWVCFQVTDEGCGIAPEQVARVFDPYFTSKKYGDDVRGFGLGLTICQKIVHLHGGVISIQSQLGRGTTVTIDLPITQNIQLLESQS